MYSTAQNVVTYSESTDVIANPERGFHKYSITDNNYNTSNNYTNIDQNELKGWRNDTDKITVIYRTFLLSSFLNASISARYLNNIQQDFNAIRNSGIKCIVRFVYSVAISGSAQQPTKARMLQHISQLGPVLTSNSDVIVFYQAGYIGTWGEWYYTNSSEFGNEGDINATQLLNRKEVIDSMLATTPSSMHIQLRTPSYKKNMYGSVPLNDLTAYQNTSNARIGFFNDSFLNSWGDYGTYSVNSEFQSPIGTADYIYLSNETQYTPMSGESSGLNAPRTDGSNALVELDLTNWSTLNRDYYPDVLTNWINSGNYKTIIKRMGYRFCLIKSTFLNNGNNLNVNIAIKNTGFARAFKERNTYLLLKNTATNSYYPFLINTDIRKWVDTINLVQDINLTELPEGNYAAYLKMPDINTSLSDKPEYSIKLANNNVWIDSLGINDLTQSFTLSNTISTYTFIGSGDWTIESNWMNNQKPPAILPSNKEIIIDPISDSNCILNTSQKISTGAKITVVSGKHFLIQGDLIIE
ncbi:MAG: DUF4832 domain-containing protein [Bacteroidota bacterium]